MSPRERCRIGRRCWHALRAAVGADCAIALTRARLTPGERAHTVTRSAVLDVLPTVPRYLRPASLDALATAALAATVDERPALERLHRLRERRPLLRARPVSLPLLSQIDDYRSRRDEWLTSHVLAAWEYVRPRRPGRSDDWIRATHDRPHVGQSWRVSSQVEDDHALLYHYQCATTGWTRTYTPRRATVVLTLPRDWVTRIYEADDEYVYGRGGGLDAERGLVLDLVRVWDDRDVYWVHAAVPTRGAAVDAWRGYAVRRHGTLRACSADRAARAGGCDTYGSRAIGDVLRTAWRAAALRAHSTVAGDRAQRRLHRVLAGGLTPQEIHTAAEDADPRVRALPLALCLAAGEHTVGRALAVLRVRHRVAETIQRCEPMSLADYAEARAEVRRIRRHWACSAHDWRRLTRALRRRVAWHAAYRSRQTRHRLAAVQWVAA